MYLPRYVSVFLSINLEASWEHSQFTALQHHLNNWSGVTSSLSWPIHHLLALVSPFNFDLQPYFAAAAGHGHTSPFARFVSTTASSDTCFFFLFFYYSSVLAEQNKKKVFLLLLVSLALIWIKALRINYIRGPGDKLRIQTTASSHKVDFLRTVSVRPHTVLLVLTSTRSYESFVIVP